MLCNRRTLIIKTVVCTSALVSQSFVQRLLIGAGTTTQGDEGHEWAVFAGEVLAVITGNGTTSVSLSLSLSLSLAGS